LAALILVLVFALGGCSSAPAPPLETTPTALPSPQVIVQTQREEVTVRVELALTPAEQNQGLMYRDRLAPDAGMLFVFPQAGSHPFWMRNTQIPLDILFIGDDRIITGIVRDARPETIEPRGGGFVSRTALEVNSGWVEEYGVRVGDRVRYEGVPGL